MVHCHAPVRALAQLALLALAACNQVESEAQQRRTSDSLGARGREIRSIGVNAPRALVESSGAAMSVTQPGVLFTVNDAGNDALLFALDTTGATRGVWQVDGAQNVDWEAVSVGSCGNTAPPGTPGSCVYIGDVGDNEERRSTLALYRVAEPTAPPKGTKGAIAAERLYYRYEDGPHDVEAMYVAPNGDVVLITKRPLKGTDGRLRPALVFRVPASAWRAAAASGRDSVVVASLVDSLPIVPGSAKLRTITDAGLSPDARLLAVRTYAQVFVFAVDSATGRTRASVPPATCDVTRLQRATGEGVTWVGMAKTLLLTSEGRRSPLVIVQCPLP
jgi:hypothetical protein